MPKGVKGPGNAGPAVKAAASAHAKRPWSEEDDTPLTAAHDPRPRCRIRECDAVLSAGGQCPACAYRARKYAKVFEAVNPVCECGAPKKPKRAGSSRLPQRCTLCQRLRAKASAKKVLVT